ncbi:MAG TPA: heparinase II/III family protein [Ferrovibrio sp.]|uniref:heparinase II/III family protein n=1 Tax=Ferrovibrio sp. TaxID=1917215 RepID=UPI002ED41F25
MTVGVVAAPLQDSIWLKLLRRLAAALYSRRAYDWLLPGKAPVELPVLPEESWPGQPAKADRLFQGRFIFAGLEVRSPHTAPWSVSAEQLKVDEASFAAWAAELHGFGWLADFAAQGGEMARRMSCSLLVSWLERHRRIQGLPWRADLAGRRLVNWLSYAHFLLQDADERFAHDFLLAIARHAAHLGRAARLAPPGLPRFSALLGLAYAAECLPPDARQDSAQHKQAAIRDLCVALDAQVLADGGHVSRNPAHVLALLRDLVPLWRFLRAIDPERAGLLQPYLDRMAPMLRFFRHGDGGLALFHGSDEGRAAEIERVLDASEAKGKPLSSASLSRFERAVARRSLLLLDTGNPPPAIIGAQPHRGLLAFEFSQGKDRLIVNCGAPRRVGSGRTADWANALSGVAAHSTLVLGRVEPEPAARISAVRHEQDGNIWFELEHDGWAAAYGGRLYRRRLFLAASGEDLRGEETVTAGAANAVPVEAVLRLHLHPGMQASLLGSGDTIILKTASGQGWRFRSGGGVLRLEDSIYFGQGEAQQGGGLGAEARRTQQIVMAGSAGGEDLVFKWALTKVG